MQPYLSKAKKEPWWNFYKLSEKIPRLSFQFASYNWIHMYIVDIQLNYSTYLVVSLDEENELPDFFCFLLAPWSYFKLNLTKNDF